jgi:hypothetical protein
MDPWHCRPKLFRGRAYSYGNRDGDHEFICHRDCNRDSDGDRYRNANCDADCDRNKRSVFDCDCNCDGDCDRRPSDGDGDTWGRIDGAGIYDADGKRGQSVRAEHRQ